RWLPLKWRYPDTPALSPEMLPKSTWEENLRHALSEKQWDVLRKYCYRAAGNRWEIGGQGGKVECHERWQFDDTWCEQTLTGLICLCPLCHKAHHLGIAKRLGLYEQVLTKMRIVNGWSNTQVKAAIDAAAALADERSRYEWHVNLSWLTSGSYALLYRLDGKG